MKSYFASWRRVSAVVVLLWSVGSTDILALDDPGATYDVYQYNGLVGTQRVNGTGWKTLSYIRTYEKLGSISAGQLLQQTNTYTYSASIMSPGLVVMGDYGVLAVPQDETGSTSTNGWQWNYKLWDTGVEGVCDLVFNFNPNPKGEPTNRVPGPVSVILPGTQGGCNAGGCAIPPAAGQTIVNSGNVDVKIYLGSAKTNLTLGSLGSLALYSKALTNGLAGRQNLKYNPTIPLANLPALVVTNDNGWISEIISSQNVARVTSVTDGFAVKVYTNATTTTPVSTTTITQPSGDLPLVIAFESDEFGAWIKQYELTTEEGGYTALTLVEKQADGTPLRRMIKTEWTNNTEWVQVELCRDSASNLVSRHAAIYNLYTNSAGNPVWRLTRSETGSGGNVNVTTKEYDAIGRTVMTVDHDGRWTRKIYESTNLGARLTQVISPWLNADTNAWTDFAQCRVQYNDSVFVTGEVSVVTNGSVIVTNVANNMTVDTETLVIAGHTNSVRTTTTFRRFSDSRIVVQTNTVWIGTNTLVTKIQYDGEGFPFETTFPDGSVESNNLSTVWSWTNGVFKGRVVDVSDLYRGSADGLNCTRTKTVKDVETKTIVDRQSWVIANGVSLLMDQEQVLAVDDRWRPTLVASPTGTNETVYGCCGIVQAVNEEGITTDYSYDELKRLIATTTDGLGTYTSYDAASRVRASYRLARGGGSMLTSSNLYNEAGERVTTADAFGNLTTYSNWVDAVNGWTYKRTTHPDGSWTEQQSYRDGQLHRTYGTATHGVEYTYSIQSDGTLVTRQTKLDDANNPTAEWTESYRDMAGRTVKTLRNGGATLSESFHNDKGQVWKQVDADGVVRLMAYNDAGQVAVQAVDINQNDQIDYAGPDRISGSQTVVTDNSGMSVQRHLSLAWTTENDTNATTLSMSDTVPGGQLSFQIANGLTNRSETVIDRASAAKTVTSTSADGNQNIAIYTNGQLMVSIRKDSTGTTLSSTTHQYDGYGRQCASTDGRGVVTVTAYDSVGRVAALTNAVGTADQQTTRFTYDIMGRRIATTMPDGNVSYSAYLPTGEVATNWGARSYPVAYTYDYSGRMKTMTTWTNFSANAGAAVTTWHYDSTNGLLAFKEYQDGQGPTYTYTPGGKLFTRTWARGLTTTYGYTPAGDLATIVYGDNTPSVTNTFDRLGRRATLSSAADAISYTYNTAGQVVSESHTLGVLNGLILTNSYDAFLRRSAVGVADASGAWLPNSGAFYGYDAASRLQVASNLTDQAATYAYHSGADLVSNIVFTSGGQTRLTTTKAFDNLGRLTEIKNQKAGGEVASAHTYTYNAANQRARAVLADGTYWDYSYDSLGQVTNGVRRWASDNSIVTGQDYGYLFDDIGNRKSTMVGGGVAAAASSYTANLLNQYISRTVPGQAVVLGSAASNATVTVNNQSVTRQGEYFHKVVAVSNQPAAVYTNLNIVAVLKNAGSNQMDIVTQESGREFVAKTPEQFTHDADGNLTGDGRWTYSWDSENRLIAMQTTTNALSSGVPNVKLQYAYDGQSRRIGKTVYTNAAGSWVEGSGSTFVYDGWAMIQEVGRAVSGEPGFTNSYVYGLDLSGSPQGAGTIGGLVATVHSGDPEPVEGFYSYDGNGNVSVLVDAATGNETARYEYGPFGEVVRASGAMAEANPFRFSTKYEDGETGLLYYGYRYYAPGVGRWVSRDPIGEMLFEHNLYGFVGNDTIDSWDLFGLWTAPDRETTKSRATTLNDGEPFTIDDLAEMIHLDKDQAFGESGWLRNMGGNPVEEVKPNCWYTVPNEAHITEGWADGQHGWLMGRKDKLVQNVYNKKKYKTIDHTTQNGFGQTRVAVINDVTKSPNIYVWSHYGHGVKGEPGNLFFWASLDYDTAGPSDFSLKYKLAEIVLYTCRAGEKRDGWSKLVATGGKLYATAEYIFVSYPASWAWNAYYPLEDH